MDDLSRSGPWQPSRPATIAIGLLSVWPFLYMGLFFAAFAYMWYSTPHRGQSGEPVIFKYIFALHCLTILLMFVLIGIYVFHAYKTDRIANDKKVLWVVILFLGNLMAFPIYWYLYMWTPVSQTGNVSSPPVSPDGSAG